MNENKDYEFKVGDYVKVKNNYEEYKDKVFKILSIDINTGHYLTENVETKEHLSVGTYSLTDIKFERFILATNKEITNALIKRLDNINKEFEQATKEIIDIRLEYIKIKENNNCPYKEGELILVKTEITRNYVAKYATGKMINSQVEVYSNNNPKNTMYYTEHLKIETGMTLPTNPLI